MPQPPKGDRRFVGFRISEEVGEEFNDAQVHAGSSSANEYLNGALYLAMRLPEVMRAILAGATVDVTVDHDGELRLEIRTGVDPGSQLTLKVLVDTGCQNDAAEAPSHRAAPLNKEVLRRPA